MTCIFAAVLAHCCPGIEISVFSTGARASNKFLIGVIKVLCMLPGGEEGIITSNKETVVLENPDARKKKSTINSFPSKVTIAAVCAPLTPLRSAAPHPLFHYQNIRSSSSYSLFVEGGCARSLASSRSAAASSCCSSWSCSILTRLTSSSIRQAKIDA